MFYMQFDFPINMASAVKKKVETNYKK